MADSAGQHSDAPRKQQASNKLQHGKYEIIYGMYVYRFIYTQYVCMCVHI